MQSDFVHRFEPASSPDDAPTLLLLHGTGGDENDLIDLGQTIAPGANLLSPRGKVLEQGMPRFFRRLAEGVFDIEDLVLRTNELADFVAAAATEYEFDAKRVTALGFSNGANIAAAMMLLRPTTLSGAVLLRAMVPLEPERRPDLRDVHVLISAGRSDPIVPADNAQRLADLLRAGGADVMLEWQAAGHNLTQTDLAVAREWAQRHVR
jgi:predicted esterase